MSRKLRLIIASLVAGPLVLSGCGLQPQKASDSSGLKSNVVLDRLAEAAALIQQDVSRLARYDHARDPVKIHPDESPHSGPLSKKISVDWHGPVRPIVEKIAQELGVPFQAQGNERSVPVVVDVRHDGVSAYDVLTDIGWQSGQFVHLAVDRVTGEVRLIFVSDNGKGGA